MAAYKCKKCGYIYDETNGNCSNDNKNNRKPFKELPENWCCPNCGTDQGQFCEFYEESKADRYD